MKPHDESVFESGENQTIETEKMISILVAVREFVYQALVVVLRIVLPCMGLKRRGLASIFH